ncbi:hypothetical protein [Helicobacter sp. WB40]|uniref:hypothetical protein n=1 Tax=Helicobacter sp. WB40 TaxID=3004130 RepID=UPI0022EBE8A6|nr:hypothetical protein [Helicobacter sp. WB40]MDA3967797.1 hypothetical protein [Helicobacter sp. WB40]
MKRVIEYIALIAILYVSWELVLAVESYKIGDFSDPVASLYFYSGWISVLCLSLSFVICNKLKRFCGLLGFIFAIIHIGIFLIIDFNFDFDLIFQDLKSKYYLYFGIASFLFFACCASLFGVFRFVYYCIYGALFFAILHIFFIQKLITINYAISLCVLTCLGVFKLYKSVK